MESRRRTDAEPKKARAVRVPRLELNTWIGTCPAPANSWIARLQISHRTSGCASPMFSSIRAGEAGHSCGCHGRGRPDRQVSRVIVSQPPLPGAAALATERPSVISVGGVRRASRRRLWLIKATQAWPVVTLSKTRQKFPPPILPISSGVKPWRSISATVAWKNPPDWPGQATLRLAGPGRKHVGVAADADVVDANGVYRAP